MTLQSQREAENTRVKLELLEQRYATLQREPAAAGDERVREWTLLSLKKLINQLKEELGGSKLGRARARLEVVLCVQLVLVRVW